MMAFRINKITYILILKIISKEVIKNKNPKLTFQTYPSSVSLNILSQNLFLTFKKCFVGF